MAQPMSILPEDVVIVRRARTPEEQDQAQKFVQDNFWLHFNTKPDPPQILFTGFCGDMIVGTMALDFASSDKQFPFEHVYGFDQGLTPWPFSRDDGTQYSRWIVRQTPDQDLSPRLSPALIYACTRFALDQGKVYGWCVIKPKPATRLRRLGIELRQVQSAHIDLEHVPENDRAYFTDPPAPQLQMMRLSQIQAAVEDYLKPFISRGLVTWEE